MKILEAMSLSLRLITDPRYATIEENAQSTPNDPMARDQAWAKARFEFIDPLYQKYAALIRSKANLRCPARQYASRHFFNLQKWL